MTTQQRLVLIISILSSFVALLDGSIVIVALPALARELGGGFAAQQWTVDAYLITLGSLMLIAGSFSDIFGRKRILAIGLVGFMVTSLLCAVAPNALMLVIARALQGATGALLVPSALALIVSTFSGPAQGKAIGSWTAWAGIASIVGPLLGGILVEISSWRWIFVVNIVPISITLWLLYKIAPENHRRKHVPVDASGALLCAIGLGGTVYALIEQARYGWGSPLVFVPFLGGAVALLLFVWRESRISNAMLPLSLFKVRNFNVGNVATFAIYAGLSVAVFLITLFIQQVGGYSAIQAGFALLPVTILMFALSSRMGALAGRYGPRFFMSVGPIIAGIAFLYLLQTDAHAAYWTQIFPAVFFFGLGLTTTVAPLTSAILGSVHPDRAGIASAFNNAVARIAGLIAIAVLGLVMGSELSISSFHQGVWFMASLLIAGGVISAVGIQNDNHTSSRSHISGM
jgi:EmrB/QacA subfamily drug resistance transporter